MYEPPIEERIRKDDQAVGLRNIGNTCYFNSLLQIYYSLPSFVEKILQFRDVENLKGKNDAETKKIESGIKLIKELKKAFGLLAIGNKSYVEPGAVLGSIVDNSGNKFHIGDERDMSEFNSLFLARITDAITAVKN
jgi:ubiquitin carboxyl-terminal hydrolase 25/28